MIFSLGLDEDPIAPLKRLVSDPLDEFSRLGPTWKISSQRILCCDC